MLAEYNVPQNRPNWLLADLILIPMVGLLVWLILDKFYSLHIYEWLAKNPLFVRPLQASSTTGVLSKSVSEIFVLWHSQILGGLVAIVATVLSFNEKIPGPGRQLYIPFRAAQVNRILKTRSSVKLNKVITPTFPPPINFADPVVQQGMNDPEVLAGRAVFLGLKKRFEQDILFEDRHKVKVEKISDYTPLIVYKDTRFRHTQIAGGSGSGKTASIIAPMIQSDVRNPFTSVVCMNPKGDEYLLKVSVDHVIKYRQSDEFRRLEAEYYQAVKLHDETRTMAKWAVEEKNTSIKPFALISLSHPEISLRYDPLQYGDADLKTKKIIYSSDATQNNSFYLAEQEAWLLTLNTVIETDPDLNGRLGLWHIYHFSSNPDKHIGEALSPIVDVDPEVKFSHLAERIRRHKEYEKALNENDKEEVDRLIGLGILSDSEKEQIQVHEKNRGRLRILMSKDPKNLAGLTSHIQQLVEDTSINGIFTESKRPSLDFREIMRTGGIIYIEVPTQSKTPQACAIARMMLMELQSLSADRDRGHENKKCEIFAYIDEFASLSYDGFLNMIDKCRSAKCGIIVAHQSLANLRKKHLSDSFKGEIMDNCASKYMLQLQDVETQKEFMQVLGSQETLRRGVSEGDSQMSGQKRGMSRGINQSFSEETEYVVTESMLNCKLGYGYVRLLEKTGKSERYACSFNYVKENDLVDFPSVIGFIANERKHHPIAPRPFYDVALDGQLFDTLRNRFARAGDAFEHMKPPAPGNIQSTFGVPTAGFGNISMQAVVDPAPPENIEPNSAGGAAPANEVLEDNDPRKFLLGG